MKELLSSNKQLRQFGLVIGFGFPIIIGYLVPLISGHVFKSWTLFVALPTFILSFLRPSLLFYPYKLWMRVGEILGIINSHLILSLVFFLVLLPIAILIKVFGYDPLKIKKININSYRINKPNHKIDLRKIF